MAYFAASADTVETNTEFAQSVDADFPILSDPGKQVAAAYGVVGEGRELPARWTFYIGKDGRILYVDKKVNPKTAGADVLARLEALGFERK